MIDIWMDECVRGGGVGGGEGQRTVPGSEYGKRAWLEGLNDTLFLLQMVG